MDAQNIESLRGIEVKYLDNMIAESIARLGYPVGCGVAPHPDATRRAAEALFDRFVAIANAIEAAFRADLAAELEKVKELEKPDQVLCSFYQVETYPDLVKAMERHIEKLQAKVPQLRDEQQKRIREG